MRITSFVLAGFVLAGLAASASAADYVFGHFEGTTLGGGWTDWAGVNTFENSTTGATEGGMSIKVVPDAIGYQQSLAVKIQDLPDRTAAFNGFTSNTHLAVDVTWDPADWNWAGSGWNGARLMMHYNEQGAGWQGNIGVDIGDANGFKVPNIDTGNPTNPGFWDITNYPTTHTRTMMWDYSSFLPALTSTDTGGWTEFMIGSNAGNYNAPIAFYFDNWRFTTPAVAEPLPGDFNGNDVVDAADYTVWRDHFGSTDDSVLNGNGDGVAGVGPGDFDLWKANFGDVPGGAGGSSLAASAVPEPGTWLLVLSALAVGRLGRRRGR
jgi:hypothetical protein